MAIGANVDPATGLPMQEQRGRPQSTVGMYGSTMGENYGVQNPLFYDMMDAIPTAATTVAWNMGRTRSTILANKTGSLKAGGIRQTLSPFRFNTLADLSNIDPEFFGTTRRVHRFPGTRGNRIPGDWHAPMRTPARSIFSRRKSRVGTALFAEGRSRPGYTPFNILSKFGNDFAPAKFRGPEGTRLFAPGTLGTLSTMASINAGSYGPEQTAQLMGSINRFRMAGKPAFSPPSGPPGLLPGPTGARYAPPWASPRPPGMLPSPRPPSLLPPPRNPPGLVNFGVRGRQSYMSSALASARFADTKFAGQAAGYFNRAQATRMGTQGATMLAEKGYVAMGGNKAAAQLAGQGSRGGQMLARAAGSRGASLGLRAVPFVGKAMLAYDITRGLGMVAGRGMKLAFEGYKSAQGDLNKRGPMGMGYVDNSVAATSRQRGVMAISNSRLNARSFLGQEASYVHQNFG